MTPAQLARRVAAAGRARSEAVVLAVMFAATFALPKGLPLGIAGLGVVNGSAIALQALAIVLVYRSNRIINFAQLQVVGAAAILFSELVRRNSFLVLTHVVCGDCVRVVSLTNGLHHYTVPVGLPHWTYVLNFWLSAATAILFALLLTTVLFGVLHIRRLASAPRLIVTVFTLGAGQVFALAGAVVGRLYNDPFAGAGGLGFPFHWDVEVGSVKFAAADVLTVVVLVIAAAVLTVYLRRSAAGAMLRGSAENPARAQTLGVNTTAINARAWLLSGLLAGVAAILSTASSSAGATGLVPVLAAAVVAGLSSLPVAVVAGLVFGLLAQASLWSYSTPAAVDGIALLVIVVVLLVQHRRSGRSDNAEQGWSQNIELRPIPTELRGLDVVRRWIAVGRLGTLAVVLGIPWLLSPSQTTLTVVVLLYAAIGLSLLVLTGWAGQISLGQLGIAAVGAYVTAVTPLPFPLPLILGALAGAATTLVIGLPALRLRGLHLAITTLAFSAAVSSLLLGRNELGRHLPRYLSRPSVLGLGLNDDRTFYYLALAFLVLVVLATVGMRRSRTGRALIACRENEALAQAFGINLMRARLSAFMVSGFIAAAAGGLYAYAAFGVSPSNFGVQQSIYVFTVVVIGGLGAVSGPLLGALYVGATTVFSSNQLLALASTGLGLVTVLLFAPGGLSQLLYGVRDAMLRRVADRYKIEVPSLFADRAGGTDAAAPIREKTLANGAKVFIPLRYRAEDQWAVAMLQKEHSHG